MKKILLPIKLILLAILYAFTLCSCYVGIDGTKKDFVMGGNLTKPDGTNFNSDTGVKSLASVAKHGIWGNVVNKTVQSGQDILNTKDSSKTTRAVNSDSTKLGLDSNAKDIEKLRIETDLEKFKIENALPEVIEP